MQVQVASAADNADLLKFYNEFTTQGLIELRPSRHLNYFAPYQLHSHENKTYLLRNDQGAIEGAASFVVRDTLYDGRITKVAYANDLRVKPTKKAIIEWSHHFLPVMTEVMSEYNINHIFSTIDLSSPIAYNTFIRPRTMKRPMPRYYLYRKVKLVSLHGRYPWASKPVPSLRIRTGNESNMEALMAYVVKRSQYRPFSATWNFDSFIKKMERLPGQKISDFIIAFDGDDNVIGCMAPWSAAGIQDYVPLSYSLRAHNFRQFLKFGWLFGMSRRLTKPVVSTGIESFLKFRHLTNVHADNEDVFESLLWRAWEMSTPQEFLVYAHCDQDYRLLPPTSWISASQSFALYAVCTPETQMPAFLDPSLSLNPEIESFSIL